MAFPLKPSTFQSSLKKLVAKQNKIVRIISGANPRSKAGALLKVKVAHFERYYHLPAVYFYLSVYKQTYACPFCSVVRYKSELV